MRTLAELLDRPTELDAARPDRRRGGRAAALPPPRGARLGRPTQRCWSGPARRSPGSAAAAAWPATSAWRRATTRSRSRSPSTHLLPAVRAHPARCPRRRDVLPGPARRPGRRPALHLAELLAGPPVAAVERGLPGLPVVLGGLPELAYAVAVAGPGDPLPRVGVDALQHHRSACTSPSSSSTPPVESIHVWCQQPRSSPAVRLCPSTPRPAPVLASAPVPTAGDRVPADVVALSSWTSHSPSQKSKACAWPGLVRSDRRSAAARASRRVVTRPRPPRRPAAPLTEGAVRLVARRWSGCCASSSSRRLRRRTCSARWTAPLLEPGPTVDLKAGAVRHLHATSRRTTRPRRTPPTTPWATRRGTRRRPARRAVRQLARRDDRRRPCSCG